MSDNQFDKRFYFKPEDKDRLQFEKLYLSAFNIDVFNEKKKTFESFDILNENDTSVRREIRKVMTFRHHITDQNYFNIPTWTYNFVKGTKFRRIRKVGNLKLGYPLFDKMKNISDAWNPPIDIVTKYGRLNYPYESLLYTAYNNSEICIAEMKIKDNDIFALITYEAIQDINTTIVGHYQYDSAYTPDENIKNRELTNFFYNEFTKEDKTGDGYLYKVSSNIIKECYTIPDDTQDGWVYPSIAMKQGYNVCFKLENAKKKLLLKGVEICKLDNKYGFVVNYVAETLKNGDFNYHKIGSDKQKELYPHIVLCE